nr:DNA repair protein RecN [Maliibacterium massiliense]
MLQHLSIRHIALIDALELSFAPGFNVLTGETGAGKSIIVDSMKLALGGRADRDLISAGEARAYVEATFFVPPDAPVRALLEEEGLLETEETSLVLARELTTSGKNTCRIGGVRVTLDLLSQVARQLVDIYGQHEHQSLLNPASHLGFLDCLASGKVAALRGQVQALCAQIASVNREMSQGFGSEQDRAQKMDMLRFQIDEIEQAQLRVGEEQELKEQRALMQASETIAAQLSGAYSALYESEMGPSAMDSVMQAAQAVGRVAHYQQAYEQIRQRLDDAYYALEDTAHTLRDLAGEVFFDPQELQRIEQRLDDLYKLKRKYGADEQAVLDFQQQAQKQLDMLEHAQERMETLSQRREALLDAYYEKACALSQARRAFAKQLEGQVMEQLRDLGMEKCRFAVTFDALPTREACQACVHAEGMDTAAFFISPNPGMPLRPLAKIISGGELSRVMLALKTISAAREGVPCMIFDEIDTGIGGQMAVVLSKKMARIARSHQVLCVTHLAPVAVMADAHLHVQKSGQQETHTQVARLAEDARAAEVARMLGGSVEDALSLEHARQMLAQARAFKQTL